MKQSNQNNNQRILRIATVGSVVIALALGTLNIFAGRKKCGTATSSQECGGVSASCPGAPSCVSGTLVCDYASTENPSTVNISCSKTGGGSCTISFPKCREYEYA